MGEKNMGEFRVRRKISSETAEISAQRWMRDVVR
jgi:hypothetical protein